MALAVRVLYNLLLPVFVLVAAPAWLLRMTRRGGLSKRLWERLGLYHVAEEFEPANGIYVHAVSVGEVVMALKLINRWLDREPREQFVLAVTTTTGFQIATTNAPPGVRVIYSPIDLPSLIGRALRRFDPRLLILVDSELWPNLLAGAKRRGVPVGLLNARLSVRSARRYQRFRAVTAPLLGQLSLVCAQAESHAALWRELGVSADAVEVTGSVKFDPAGSPLPARREEFQSMIDAFGVGRPVVLAASTHAGEEELIASAIREASSEALPVLLPRHAERRVEVSNDLRRHGFEVVLRSAFRSPDDASKAALVVDSTGELRDWTAHADAIVIGKSLLGRGGQNPGESILAGVPFICGRHMSNFEPLVSQMVKGEGCHQVGGEDLLAELVGVIERVLQDQRGAQAMADHAGKILDQHRGATDRSVDLLRELAGQRDVSGSQ